ncbi:MAG: hypothetical protein E7350_02250 [Clostridiales bacterium]|nr:hypothetical protein [Clostridiales bacterium]
MKEIMSLALEHGLWAVMFCFLFLYMLKDAKIREKKYTKAIETLSIQLMGVTNALKICEDVKEIDDKNEHTLLEIRRNIEFITEGLMYLRANKERL